MVSVEVIQNKLFALQVKCLTFGTFWDKNALQSSGSMQLDSNLHRSHLRQRDLKFHAFKKKIPNPIFPHF